MIVKMIAEERADDMWEVIEKMAEQPLLYEDESAVRKQANEYGSGTELEIGIREGAILFARSMIQLYG